MDKDELSRVGFDIIDKCQDYNDARWGFKNVEFLFDKVYGHIKIFYKQVFVGKVVADKIKFKFIGVNVAEDLLVEKEGVTKLCYKLLKDASEELERERITSTYKKLKAIQDLLEEVRNGDY